MYIIYSKEEQKLLDAKDRIILEKEFKIIQLQCNRMIKSKKETLNKNKKLVEDPTKKSVLNRKIKRKYNINFDYFSEVNLENSYWAGFIAADGHISKKGNISICLCGKDHNHLEAFKKAVDYEGPIRYYDNIVLPSGTITTQSRFASTVKSFQEDLKNNFNICSGNKTYNLQPPNNLTIEQSLAYLKGLIDGDGHIKIGPRVKRLEILVTHSMANWCSNLINSVSANVKRNDCSNIRPHPKHTMCSVYQVSGPQFIKLATIIKELNLPELKRKWIKLTPLVSNN